MDSPSSPSLARLVRGVALALVIGLVGGGAVGFATAAGDESTFQVPPPMGGDQALYTVTGPGAAWDGQEAHIEVRAPEPMMLEDGRWVSAALMRAGADAARTSFTFGSTEFEFVLVGWRAAYVDTASGKVIATSDGGVSGGGGGSTGLPILGGTSSSDEHVTLTMEFGPGTTACGVRSPLQERPVQAGERVAMSGCRPDGDAVGFTVVGLRPFEDGEALLLANMKHGTQFWYQGGLPYPVRLDFAVGTDQQETWTMTGFTRGTEPLVPGPLPEQSQPVPIVDESASRLGPGLAGFTSRFSLEQAMERAVDDSQEVVDFISAHPDWFLRGAEYEEEEQAGQVRGSWFVRIRGDSDELWVSVYEPTGDPSPIPSDVRRLVGDIENQAGVTPTSSDVFVWDLDADEPAWPDVCRPDQLPTVGSLAQRWAQMEQRPVQEANAYAFQLWCFGFGDAPSPSLSVMAGDARLILPPESSGSPLDPAQTQNSTQVLRMVAVNGRGELAIETTETASSRSSWGALQDPAQQGAGNPIEDAASITWAAPTGPVAASITVVSILAGLLYWLWPALKGGAFGFFSRIQGDQLLDHPVRAELVQRIEAHPGIHYQDLVRSMGKGKGAIEHHLRKLQDGGHVKMLRSAGYTCFFPVAYDRRLAAAAPALKSDGARRILAAIRNHPGGSASAITLATGLSPAAVNHHLQRLGAAGLVDVTRNGRSLVLHPTELARVALVS